MKPGKVLLIAAAALMQLPATSAARAAESAEAPAECSAVRDAIRQHGRAKTYLWAVSQGYSQSDIARARKACRV